MKVLIKEKELSRKWNNVSVYNNDQIKDPADLKPEEKIQLFKECEKNINVIIGRWKNYVDNIENPEKPFTEWFLEYLKERIGK